MTKTNKDNNTARFIARTLGIAILVFIVSYAACMLTPVNTSYVYLEEHQQQAIAAQYAKAFAWADAPEIDHKVAIGIEGDGYAKCLNNCHVEVKETTSGEHITWVVANDSSKDMKVVFVANTGSHIEDVFTINGSLDITDTSVLTIDKDSAYGTVSAVFAR